MTVKNISAHGGTLIDRVLRGDAREAALERVANMPQLVLNPVNVSDLELVAVGAFSPLTGFMGSADYRRVVDDMRLDNGLVWSMPITLDTTTEMAQGLHDGQEIALVEEDTGRVLGILELAERYTYDKEREAQQVYRTTDVAHPGVARLYQQGDVLLAGDIWLLNMPSNLEFPDLRHTPAEARRMFAQNGWRRVVGFQTRNPVHRAHEYIQKVALEIVDGLFLHPLVGETKSDDIPADVRIESYRSLLRDYYPPDRVLLGVYPAAMRYAGPREAIFHAIARKNYGCTHFIVGRDHAGVGKYYGTYDAQLIFDDFEPGELGITPLFFEHAFYCKLCGAVITAKTCPHDSSNHVFLSGTQVRDMLQRGEAPPPEFTRPEVAEILINGYRQTAGETEPSQPARPAPKAGQKVFVIGMDCLTPQLVFDQWRDELPNLRRLMEQGVYGELESTVPPITVPAWACMLSGKDPGQLGFYGFRNRADHSYDQMSIATARAVQDDRVWNVLDKAGKRSIIVGVPQTYPPSPLNGEMVTSFLTPSIQSQYTYPPELRDEIASVVGEYMLDVPNFRTDDKDWLLRKIQEMSEKQFRLVRHMLRTRTWDFFMMVGMGPDRIHHGFWQYMDPAHPKYEPGSPYKDAIKEFYLYLDREIGELLSLLGDDVAVLVVSDHGAQAMEGGICINEWLMQEGYLTLKQPPNKVVPLSKVEIDWSRTKSWGAGGYYGRLFLNVQGREPQGVIPAADYEKVRDEIIAKLEAITDPAGRNIGTRAFKPEDVYREVNNIPPDLIVYFGNLAWRSVGSVGLGAVHTFENDTGPDDANHAQNGLFIVCDGHSGPGQREHRHIQSIASTILKLMGVPVPEDMVYPPA